MTFNSQLYIIICICMHRLIYMQYHFFKCIDNYMHYGSLMSWYLLRVLVSIMNCLKNQQKSQWYKNVENYFFVKYQTTSIEKSYVVLVSFVFIACYVWSRIKMISKAAKLMTEGMQQKLQCRTSKRIAKKF